MKRTGAASVAVLVAGSGKHLLADEPPVYGTSSEIEVEEETQTYNCAITDLEHTAVWTWDPANNDLLDSPAQATPQILTNLSFNISGALAHAIPSGNPNQPPAAGIFTLRHPSVASCHSPATLDVSASPGFYALSSFFAAIPLSPTISDKDLKVVRTLKVDFAPETADYAPAGIATIVKDAAKVMIGELKGEGDFYLNRWNRPGVCLEKISKLVLKLSHGPSMTVEVALGAKLRFKRKDGNGPLYLNCVAPEVYQFTVDIDRIERDYSSKAKALVFKPFLTPETLELPPGQIGQYAFDGAEFYISVGPRYNYGAMVASSSFAPKEIDDTETQWYGETDNHMSLSLAKESLTSQIATSMANLAMVKAVSMHKYLEMKGYDPLPFSERRNTIQAGFVQLYRDMIITKLSGLFTNGWDCRVNAKAYEDGGVLSQLEMSVLNAESAIGSFSEANIGDGTSSSANFGVHIEPAVFGCSAGGATFGTELASQDYVEIVVTKGSSVKVTLETENPTFKNPGESKDDAVKRLPIATQVVSGSVTAKACCGIKFTFELEMKLTEPQDEEPHTDHPTAKPTNTATISLTAASEIMPAAEVTMIPQK